MADTQKSIQSELESNGSELSLSCVLSPFEDGDNLSDTDSGDVETEDTVNSMGSSPNQHISLSLIALIPTDLTKTAR